MALDLNLRVSKDDFQRCITTADTKMGELMDVIERYNDAKKNLDQFIEEDDANFQKMLERVEQNISAARRSYNALKEQKQSLQSVVDKLESMSSKVGQTIDSAIGAAGSVINAAFKVDDVL